MNDSRPVNLDLGTISFPITAIASILHRVCAVISWVGLGFLLYVLCFVLGLQSDYNTLENALQTHFLVQFIAWGLLSAFGYYCVGSVKHIIQDFGFCEDFEGGKLISWVAIIMGVVLSLLAGVLVWA
ncbi:succinate dehydrogenase, cytochrome b556 subunit [Candidatus Endobugula sertula]|uniref:Succinate dehydrogenase cytochrome b556 subunit n=1 Tax=Candidatus Endobugula sertula TaxID=62101 RepID=A0A1D2QPG9_9GAMM|nr:succinate dehydrogenase, cytochrome b556 subunit [Candidatus Endobugula sertula]